MPSSLQLVLTSIHELESQFRRSITSLQHFVYLPWIEQYYIYILFRFVFRDCRKRTYPRSEWRTIDVEWTQPRLRTRSGVKDRLTDGDLPGAPWVHSLVPHCWSSIRDAAGCSLGLALRKHAWPRLPLNPFIYINKINEWMNEEHDVPKVAFPGRQSCSSSQASKRSNTCKFYTLHESLIQRFHCNSSLIPIRLSMTVCPETVERRLRNSPTKIKFHTDEGRSEAWNCHRHVNKFNCKTAECATCSDLLHNLFLFMDTLLTFVFLSFFLFFNNVLRFHLSFVISILTRSCSLHL